MKRYCSKFEFTQEFLEEHIRECLNHRNGVTRWFRKDTSYFLADSMIKFGFFPNEKRDIVAKKVRKDVCENLYFYDKMLVPLIAADIKKEIEERRIELSPIIYRERWDSSSLKLRNIGITSIKQQVLDYIVIGAMKDMLMSKIGVFQCSSIEGRGQLYAKRFIEKFIHKKLKSSRYVVKFDIKKYYDSIPHDKLFELLERDIKNEDVLYLVKTLVSTYSDNGVGLCIGTYLSQYLANYYLSYLYHEITERMYVVKKSRGVEKCTNLVNHVIFYMDDIAIFGSNKKHLKKAMKLIRKYLKGMGLELKNDTYQVIDMYKKGAFVDMVGYKVYRRKTSIRRRIYKRASRTIRSINKNKVFNTKMLRKFMSYHGYFKHSNCRKWVERGYFKLFKLLKGVLSYEAKYSTVQCNPT